MEMTEAAANKLRPFLKEEEGVRLAVKGGGCAGFEYKFGVVPLEDKEEDTFLDFMRGGSSGGGGGGY